jgi:hypothetical protein
VAVHCRIKFIVNLWPQSGALGVLLILVAIVLLFAFLLVRRSSGVRKIKNKPLTSISAFNTLESQGHSASSGQPRLTRIGWSVMIMSLAMGISGAGLMCVTFRKFELDNRFAKEAQTTTAAILKTSNMRGASNHSQRHRIIQYQFQVNGLTYRGTADAPSLRSLANARRSEEIDVSYLPSDPAINRLAEERNLPIVIGLIPLTLPSLFFVVFVRQLRRDFVLARLGRLTTGIAVGTANYSHSTSIYYDFPNGRAGVTRGRSMLPFSYSGSIGLGSGVQVLYLPGDPERNALKRSLCWSA